MSTQRFAVSYAAHTSSCTFLLDAEGICRRIVMAPKGKRRATSRTAVRCVGAQYVASLDGSAAGGLVEMPRVGAAMLFARVDERGRVVLVRTGIVTSFESNAGEDPFVEPEDEETVRPSVEDSRRMKRRGGLDVQTSAPEVVHTAPMLDRDDDITDPDWFDPNARTQRMRALRPDEIAAARGDNERTDPNVTTSEYRAADYETLPRSTHPANVRGGTLRTPHRDIAIEDDDDEETRRPVPTTRPVATPTYGAPSRRGGRGSGGHAAAAVTLASLPDAPHAVASDVQIMTPRRRRGG